MWDANVILHEWDLDKKDKPCTYLSDLDEVIQDEVEPINNLIIWVYENGSFVPFAKKVMLVT